MKYKLLTATVMICASYCHAQDLYKEALGQIARNCPEMTVEQRRYETSLAENVTGLAPENPEVEYAYLVNGDGDHRQDVSVMQSFDFPTVYANRSKLSASRNATAKCLYDTQRHDILLKANLLLAELVYYNALYQICEQNRQSADQMFRAYQKLYEVGEATKIDYNKAAANLALFTNRMLTTAAQRDAIVAELTRMNGNKPLTFDLTDYQDHLLPADFEQWFDQAQKQYPALKYMQAQEAESNRIVTLTKSEGLPRFSLGYKGEFMYNDPLQGIAISVSIPLWQNRNKVKYAKSAAALAQAATYDMQQDYYCRMRADFEKAKALTASANDFKAILEETDNASLLQKALEKGQMSLIDYITETQYYFDLKQELLQTLRDREFAWINLNSYAL